MSKDTEKEEKANETQKVPELYPPLKNPLPKIATEEVADPYLVLLTKEIRSHFRSSPFFDDGDKEHDPIILNKIMDYEMFPEEFRPGFMDKLKTKKEKKIKPHVIPQMKKVNADTKEIKKEKEDSDKEQDDENEDEDNESYDDGDMDYMKDYVTDSDNMDDDQDNEDSFVLN